MFVWKWLSGYLVVMSVLLVVMSAGVVGCRRTNQYPVEPIIDSIHLSSYWVRAGNDTLLVFIYVRDGDGDLGREPSDTTRDLFVQDMRTQFTYTYQMPMIDPVASYRGIRATIMLELINLLLCRPGYREDSTRLEIWLRDRSGHESNRVRTGLIRIGCW